MEIKQLYDSRTVAILRRALNEVVSDQRVVRSKPESALAVAEHLLAQAASGERDLERLKASTFAKLGIAAKQRHDVRPL